MFIPPKRSYILVFILELVPLIAVKLFDYLYRAWLCVFFFNLFASSIYYSMCINEPTRSNIVLIFVVEIKF